MLHLTEFLGLLHPVLWLAWLIYWIVSARGVKRTVRRESTVERLPYTLPLAAALILFWFPHNFPFLQHRVFHEIATFRQTSEGPVLEVFYVTVWIGTLLLIAGQFFTIWARVALGTNWSGTVTVKQDHELIQTGPYRLVRHPIYTGLLLAVSGSALAQDLWSSVLAVALLFVSFWVKLLREEAWMRETFGVKYDAYCARTKRLVPFLW